MFLESEFSDIKLFIFHLCLKKVYIIFRKTIHAFYLKVNNMAGTNQFIKSGISLFIISKIDKSLKIFYFYALKTFLFIDDRRPRKFDQE